VANPGGGMSESPRPEAKPLNEMPDSLGGGGGKSGRLLGTSPSLATSELPSSASGGGRRRASVSVSSLARCWASSQFLSDSESCSVNVAGKLIAGGGSKGGRAGSARLVAGPAPAPNVSPRSLLSGVSRGVPRSLSQASRRARIARSSRPGARCGVARVCGRARTATSSCTSYLSSH
jgi:hypothetical protein